MRIALDAMGGDFGPQPNVAGAIRALTATPDLTVVLIGDQLQIDPILSAIADLPRVFPRNGSKSYIRPMSSG